MYTNELKATIEQLAAKGKGILAADESTGTIGKRFLDIGIENNEENRRQYRSLLCTTPKLSDYISGVILFEETLEQKADNDLNITSCFSKQNIVPGIKVDKGLVSIGTHTQEKITQGLDGLSERLLQYKDLGARFAKWRAVYSIDINTPSTIAMRLNAEMLARYAAVCQGLGIVPIVEPELLMNGEHSLKIAAEVTEQILNQVFIALREQNITLENIILKPNMVIHGQKCPEPSSTEEIAESTIRVLRRTVPAAVPSINFLSGGQTPEQATENLNAINSLGNQPWNISFSYGRALQETCLKAWRGEKSSVRAGQEELYHRSMVNGKAAIGQYTVSLEEA